MTGFEEIIDESIIHELETKRPRVDAYLTDSEVKFIKLNTWYGTSRYKQASSLRNRLRQAGFESEKIAIRRVKNVLFFIIRKEELSSLTTLPKKQGGE